MPPQGAHAFAIIPCNICPDGQSGWHGACPYTGRFQPHSTDFFVILHRVIECGKYINRTNSKSMRCRLCYKEIDDDSKFCRFCGYEQSDYHYPTFKAFLKKVTRDKRFIRMLTGMIGGFFWCILIYVILLLFTKSQTASLSVAIAINLLIIIGVISKFDRY